MKDMQISTPSEREIMMSRIFDAPRALLWRAWTSPEYLPQWMLGPEGWTMTTCEIDLQPGGKWRFAWLHSDGHEMAMHGDYREVAPPSRLVTTEHWGGEWPETLNTLVLTEENGRTTMRLSMLYPSQEARNAALKSGMKEGVSLSFDRLAALLASAAMAKDA